MGAREGEESRGEGEKKVVIAGIVDGSGPMAEPTIGVKRRVGSGGFRITSHHSNRLGFGTVQILF
jgi:hypothetical protein